MFLISRIMPQHFVRIFTDEPEYAKLAVWGIRVFTLMIIPLSFQYVIVDGLTGVGYDKDIVKSFSDEENPLFCRDLPDPAYMDGAVRFLCGTFCGRRGGMPLVCDIFLYLSEIFAGRRTPRRDQTVNISPGQYLAWGYYFIRNPIVKKTNLLHNHNL